MAISTKERIVDVSIDLFSKDGYSETSIRDIAKVVGIKTSSIYYYFENKEAILNHILEKYIEIVDEKKHQHKWYQEKDFIAAGILDISAEKILNYMFFKFDEQEALKIRKMLKIICSEAVRNATVRGYEHQVINSGYQFIKSVLDTLLESGKISKCDTVKVSGILYSISFAFMHLDTITVHQDPVDMYGMGKGADGTDMFSLLEYMLKIVIEGNCE